MTKDIRLAIFQFKIVHHILPTNATKIVQHDKCHLCDQAQTLKHLFVLCPDVQAFWKTFCNWWNFKNDEFIIYGFRNNLREHLGLNLCLIIAKYYIYFASREKEPYYFEAFLVYLKSKLAIEKNVKQYHKSILKLNASYFHFFHMSNRFNTTILKQSLTVITRTYVVSV